MDGTHTLNPTHLSIHSALNPSRHHEKTQNTNVKVAVVLIQACQSKGSQPASGISSGGFVWQWNFYFNKIKVHLSCWTKDKLTSQMTMWYLEILQTVFKKILIHHCLSISAHSHKRISQRLGCLSSWLGQEESLKECHLGEDSCGQGEYVLPSVVWQWQHSLLWSFGLARWILLLLWRISLASKYSSGQIKTGTFTSLQSPATLLHLQMRC